MPVSSDSHSTFTQFKEAILAGEMQSESCCKARKDVNFYFLNRVQRGCRVFFYTGGVLPLFKVSRLLHVNLIKCI